jgi:hypothetical protein
MPGVDPDECDDDARMGEGDNEVHEGGWYGSGQEWPGGIAATE